MSFLRNTLFAAAAAVAATSAQAVTVVDHGNTYSIDHGSEFIGDVEAAGGAGSWWVRFDAAADPLLATASATIGPIVSGTFTNLMMSWVSAFDASVLSTVAVTPLSVSLDTLFSTGVPDTSSQILMFTWDNSLAGASFDLEVSAVPLPAGGLLLIGAFGALALVRRRKSA